MKKILLFGAGKSATVLIDYLIGQAPEFNWEVCVADANLTLIEKKTQNRPHSVSVAIDVADENLRKALIESADIVISMMPPALHILIAVDCLAFGKHLLTASYADDQILALQPQLEEKGILFLCEMGLDPGIDHMSAMKIIDEIHEKGGSVTSFKSHCGGLVAPVSDDNPWHYKISWNPRNVVLAGKAGAIYKKDGLEINESYNGLFNPHNIIQAALGDAGQLSYYPNRNSIPYIELYHLTHADTFIRTTLRHPEFLQGWNSIVNLGLTDETPAYQTDGMSFKDFYNMHFAEKNIDWQSFILTLSDAALFQKQMEFLGLEDAETFINKGFCSAATVLQFVLETKLVLNETDLDMVVMLHEIEYLLENKLHTINSYLVVKGKNQLQTAMAATVGLPLGIAAKMILNGEINLKGVHIPVLKEIYQPVLSELVNWGIAFEENQF